MKNKLWAGDMRGKIKRKGRRLADKNTGLSAVPDPEKCCDQGMEREWLGLLGTPNLNSLPCQLKYSMAPGPGIPPGGLGLVGASLSLASERAQAPRAT